MKTVPHASYFLPCLREEAEDPEENSEVLGDYRDTRGKSLNP